MQYDSATQKWKLASGKAPDPAWHKRVYTDIDAIIEKEKQGRYIKVSEIKGRLMDNPYVVEVGRKQGETK